MLREVREIDAYYAFIAEMKADEAIGDGGLKTLEQYFDDIKRALLSDDEQVYVIEDDGKIRGFFVFLFLDKEKYSEMLVGLAKEAEVYEQMFAYVKEKHRGYELEMVINARNVVLRRVLANMGAEFDCEQLNMYLDGKKTFSMSEKVCEYREEFYDSYRLIHNTDLYWTADKVLAAIERFRVAVVVEHNEVVAYADVALGKEYNVIFDLLVAKNYRNRGLGSQLLAFIINLNGDRGLLLQVDIDNEAAIHLYRKMGFVKRNINTLYVHLGLY